MNPQYVTVFSYLSGPGTARLCPVHADSEYRRAHGLPVLGSVQVSRRWACCDRCYAIAEAFAKGTQVYQMAVAS